MEKKELKYEGKHNLEDGQYYVEIWTNKNDDMVVEVQHMEFPENYIIEIESQNVAKLMKEFTYDYSNLVNHLKLTENRRMAIVKPKKRIIEYNSDMENMPA